MTTGFAAHLILMADTQYKSAIVLIDDNHVLKEIRPLDRETPFTRFYDGALLVLERDATPEAPGRTPKPGERISVWQQIPFNLQEQIPLPATRILRIA